VGVSAHAQSPLAPEEQSSMRLPRHSTHRLHTVRCKCCMYSNVCCTCSNTCCACSNMRISPAPAALGFSGMCRVHTQHISAAQAAVLAPLIDEGQLHIEGEAHQGRSFFLLAPLRDQGLHTCCSHPELMHQRCLFMPQPSSCVLEAFLLEISYL